MNKSHLTALLFTSLLTLPTLGYTAPTAPATLIESNQQCQHPQLLFVITATEMDLSLLKAQAAYRLTLHHLSPMVTYFADRPCRQRGLLSMANFIQAWSEGKNSFKSDHPNADIVAYANSSNDKSLQITVALSKPSYDATQDSLSFIATPIANQPLEATLANRYQHASVFIDFYMWNGV